MDTKDITDYDSESEERSQDPWYSSQEFDQLFERKRKLMAHFDGECDLFASEMFCGAYLFFRTIGRDPFLGFLHHLWQEEKSEGVCPFEYFIDRFDLEEDDPNEAGVYLEDYCRKYDSYMAENYLSVTRPTSIPEYLTFLIKVIPGYCQRKFFFSEVGFLTRISDESWVKQHGYVAPIPSEEEKVYNDGTEMRRFFRRKWDNLE